MTKDEKGSANAPAREERRPPWHRRSYLVNRGVQLGPVWRMGIALLAPVLLLYAVFLFSLLHGTPEWCDRLFSPLIELFTVLIASAAVLTVLAGVWIALFLHRVVGFTKRLEMHLDEFSRTGNWQEIRLRQNDLFHGLMDKLNEAMGRASRKR